MPGPCEWPECENPAEGAAGVLDGGRLRFVTGTVNTRSAAAPSIGQEAALPASRAGRDTSNSSAHFVQRNG